MRRWRWDSGGAEKRCEWTAGSEWIGWKESGGVEAEDLLWTRLGLVAFQGLAVIVVGEEGGEGAVMLGGGGRWREGVEQEGVGGRQKRSGWSGGGDGGGCLAGERERSGDRAGRRGAVVGGRRPMSGEVSGV